VSEANPKHHPSPATPTLSSRIRDRRSRQTFWIDDRVVDDFGPVMGRYRFGAAALSVYAVLARRADREGDSWPSLRLIATESGSCARTVHKALRLLELLGLVEISACYERGSQRQTSNVYTLLTPPDEPPEIDPDPKKWPPPTRRSMLVGNGNRTDAVAASRIEPGERAGERPVRGGQVSVTKSTTPPHPVHPPPRTGCTPPPHPVHPPPARRAPQEGNTVKDYTVKERSGEKTKNERAREGSFTIEEIGLTNRQVWAATLGELVRRGDVGRAELESWLRPAALIGRDGATLILGAPNAVTRDRIATRLLPAVRDALGATIGAPVGVSVVVADRG
jgi:hypothetical protein